MLQLMPSIFEISQLFKFYWHVTKKNAIIKYMCGSANTNTCDFKAPVAGAFCGSWLIWAVLTIHIMIWVINECSSEYNPVQKLINTGEKKSKSKRFNTVSMRRGVWNKNSTFFQSWHDNALRLKDGSQSHLFRMEPSYPVQRYFVMVTLHLSQMTSQHHWNLQLHSSDTIFVSTS